MKIDQFELRALGYTGGLDQDGYVEHDQVRIPLDQKVAVTRAMVDLLTDVKLGGGGQAPKFYVATFEGSRIGPVKYRATKEALDQTLLMDGIVEGGAAIPVCGSVNAAAGAKRRYEWAPVPRAGVLTQLPTVDVVREWPDFYIAGPGRALASAMPCPHAYHLTDSCPNCDAEQEADATVAAPTGRERGGEHWNARLIRSQEAREDPLRAAIRLAYETAQQDLSDIRQSFASDVAFGAVRAARLWARKAMKAETTESVWNHAMTTGYADGDWDVALAAAEQHAVHLLKESVHPTRNAVDKALCEVQGRTAAELLDTIESFRKTVEK